MDHDAALRPQSHAETAHRWLAEASESVAALYRRSAAWRSATAADRLDLAIVTLEQACQYRDFDAASAALVLVMDARQALADEQLLWLTALDETLTLARRDYGVVARGVIDWFRPRMKNASTPWKGQLIEILNTRFVDWFTQHYGDPNDQESWDKWKAENCPEPAPQPTLKIYDDEEDEDGQADKDEGFPFGATGTQP